ncbi:MAG: hypothetical protein JNM00_11465 [Flavobacteriales bacterium]|nr:hypothetical protein [Flavobacteriales bacterium]
MRFLPYWLAIAWFALRYTTGVLTGYSYAAGKTTGILSNLLIILLLILLTLYSSLKGQTTLSFLDQFKQCVKAALKYILAMTALMVLYYTVLSPELEDARRAGYEEVVKALDSDEEIIAFRNQNPAYQSMSRQEITDNAKRNIDFFLSIKAIAGAGALVLVLISFAYTALGVWLWRKVLKPPQAARPARDGQ